MPQNQRTAPATDYRGALGALAARCGDRTEAERISEELGRIEKGRWYGVRLHRDINLEPLWDYPLFQDLIRPKG